MPRCRLNIAMAPTRAAPSGPTRTTEASPTLKLSETTARWMLSSAGADSHARNNAASTASLSQGRPAEPDESAAPTTKPAAVITPQMYAQAARGSPRIAPPEVGSRTHALRAPTAAHAAAGPAVDPS